MKEFLGLIVVVLLILTIPILLLLGFNIVFNINYCNNLVELNSDRNFEWRLFGGCFMQTQEGVWQEVNDIIFLDKPINGVK